MWVCCGRSQEKCKAAEVWVLGAGDGKNVPTGSSDIATPEIFVQEIGNSGRVGVTKDYF